MPGAASPPSVAGCYPVELGRIRSVEEGGQAIQDKKWKEQFLDCNEPDPCLYAKSRV